MKLKRRKIKRGRIEIIPMIDTIVILLIFYMTFSRFAEAEKESSLVLPTSKAGIENKSTPGQITLNMFKTDEVFFQKQKYAMDDIPALITKIRLADPVYAHPIIVLRGSKDMTYADLSAFMKACSKAKIADVTFTTEEKQ